MASGEQRLAVSQKDITLLKEELAKTASEVILLLRPVAMRGG